MNNPLISIIVPCYNQAIYLSDALDSVLSQSYKNWECIIVDDGSTDATNRVATQYTRTDIRFKYIYQNNSGLSAARNRGVLASSGEYILPLDSDDKIADNYLEEAVCVFFENPSVKIVYCRAALFGIRKGEWILPNFTIEKMLGRNCIFCSAVYKRCDFDIVGGYNTNMKFGFEDWDFWLSIIELGGDVYQIDQILFYYRIRKRSMARLLNHEQMNYLRRQIWENHRRLYADYFFDPKESFEYKNLVEFKPISLVLKLFSRL